MTSHIIRSGTKHRTGWYGTEENTMYSWGPHVTYGDPTFGV